MPTPPPDKRSRVMFWLGCAGCGFLLLLAGVAATMAWLLLKEQPRQVAREMLPDGWRESLRSHYRLPAALARLAPEPASDSAIPDLAILAPPFDSAWRGTTTAVMRLRRDQPPQPGDEDAMAAAQRDTTLDRYAAAARATRYDVSRRLDDPPGRPLLMPPLGPGMRLAGNNLARGIERLVLRGEKSMRRGDIARARADFTSAVALGRLIWRNDPSYLALRYARSGIDDGALGLARLAARTRDAALARDAADVHGWATLRREWFILTFDPDTTASIAADTALPRAARIEALEAASWISIATPTRMFFGPSDYLMRTVRGVTHDPDPIVARAAIITDSTLSRLDRMWPTQRIRALSRGR